MNKLNVVVVAEEEVINLKGGCGKNNPSLCGTRECEFSGGKKDD